MTTTDDAKTILARLHQALGIPSDYAESCKLPLCIEPATLVNTELDFYQREQRLTPAAFLAWSRMREAALGQEISLFLISAFRGYQYQHDLIAKKLATGADYYRYSACERRSRLQRAPQWSGRRFGYLGLRRLERRI